MCRLENGTPLKRRNIKDYGEKERIDFILCQKNIETPIYR